MKKRKHNSKALTAAERRACLDGLILTADDEPALPDWWIVSPLNTGTDGSTTAANPQRLNATGDRQNRLETAASHSKTRTLESNAANDAESASECGLLPQGTPMPTNWATPNNEPPDAEVVPLPSKRVPSGEVVACDARGTKHRNAQPSLAPTGFVVRPAPRSNGVGAESPSDHPATR